MSLAGAVGNGVAVSLWALLSLLPLGGLWALRRRLQWEDALLALLTPLLGLTWWCAVNPGRLWVQLPEMELAYLSGAVWMTLICWTLLRLLRACFAGRVAWAVGVLLRLMQLGLTAAIFGGSFGALVSGWRALLAGNTDGHALSQGFLWWRGSAWSRRCPTRWSSGCFRRRRLSGWRRPQTATVPRR